MIIKNHLILFLKGMAMGISDLIPGISGGTIALLLGIYEKFIQSLKSINHSTLIYLFRLAFKKLKFLGNLKFISFDNDEVKELNKQLFKKEGI